MIDVTALRASTVWALLVGFCAVLGAFVALSLTGHDPQTLAVFVATVGGFLGLGAHQAATGKTIAKIDKQTNGVLTGRIKAAVAEALALALPVHITQENPVIPVTPTGLDEGEVDVTADPAPETPNAPQDTQSAPDPEPTPAPSEPTPAPAPAPAPQLDVAAITAAVVAALQAAHPA